MLERVKENVVKRDFVNLFFTCNTEYVQFVTCSYLIKARIDFDVKLN